MCRLRAERVQKIADALPPTEISATSRAICWSSAGAARYGAIRAGVEAHARARPQDRPRAPAPPEPVPARPRRHPARYERVLVPELNLGQLVKLIRARYLVDAQRVSPRSRASRSRKAKSSTPSRAQLEAELRCSIAARIPRSRTPTRARRRKKDFTSDQDVRWCPGCGDYSILAQVQRVLPAFGIPKEKYVFVSGIGCSSRFPYYMDTYGMHTIHGRAPAIATGIKSRDPDLAVWVVTGDGDGAVDRRQPLHARAAPQRRHQAAAVQQPHLRPDQGPVQPDLASSARRPSRRRMGSVDYPVDPVSVALGAGATFVARTLDVDVAAPAGDAEARRTRTRAPRSSRSTRTATSSTTARSRSSPRRTPRPTHDSSSSTASRCASARTRRRASCSAEPAAARRSNVARARRGQNLLVHDETSEFCSLVVSRLGAPDFPTPIGVFRAVERPSYDELAEPAGRARFGGQAQQRARPAGCRGVDGSVERPSHCAGASRRRSLREAVVAKLANWTLALALATAATGCLDFSDNEGPMMSIELFWDERPDVATFIGGTCESAGVATMRWRLVERRRQRGRVAQRSVRERHRRGRPQAGRVPAGDHRQGRRRQVRCGARRAPA